MSKNTAQPAMFDQGTPNRRSTSIEIGATAERIRASVDSPQSVPAFFGQPLAIPGCP